MIDAALLAASINDRDGSNIRQFSEDVLGQALVKSRSARDFNRMTADYEMFRELGTLSPLAETQMAYFHSSLSQGRSEEAEAHFRRASEIVDDRLRPVIDANLGCWLISNDEFVEGFNLVKGLELPAGYQLCKYFGAMHVLGSDEFDLFVLASRDEAEAAASSKINFWLSKAQKVAVISRIRLVLADPVAVEP